MSIEGLWVVLTAPEHDPENFIHGGIVVFETGRVFGGDQSNYMVGTYEVSGSSVTAQHRLVTWNNGHGPDEDAFGMLLPVDIQVVVRGEMSEDGIEAVAQLASGLGPRVPVRLRKVSELP